MRTRAGTIALGAVMVIGYAGIIRSMANGPGSGRLYILSAALMPIALVVIAMLEGFRKDRP